MTGRHPNSKPHPGDEIAVGQYAKKLVQYRQSIFYFVDDMWGLTPQPVKPEYEEQWAEVQRASYDTWERLKPTVKPEWFGDRIKDATDTTAEEWEWYDFQKGKHLTWQQTLILMGVDKANLRDGKPHLTIVSGHGTGKSCTCSFIVLWFLYCYIGAQVPVTAPTSHQMKDVLWKEMSIWIKKMPEEVQPLYEWSSEYIRMAYDPEGWFARARTSTKENTEAIAGVHSSHVCIVADESSGIPEQVFTTAEGALTSGNVLVVLISNGTRTTGYFYDTHHKHKADWQTFQFNCEHSPIVDKKYVERQAKRHGRDSDEFKIRVSGGFPAEDAMDDSGYIQLLPETKIIVVPKIGDTHFIGRKILGIDPSGEGKDKCTFVLRDRFHMECVKELSTTNDKEIAEMAITLIDRYKLDPNDVVIGSFGVGATVGKEIAVASRGRYDVYMVLEGNHPDYEEEHNGLFFRRKPDEKDENDVDLYLNLRALMYFRLRKWLIAGGEIVDTAVDNSEFRNEVKVIKYKRSLQGNKIQLMSKKEMLKERIKSPNKADAGALTLLRDMDDDGEQSDEERRRIEAEENEVDDPYAAL